MNNIFNNPLSSELADLLYLKLKESKNGELKLNEILDIYRIKSEYGLSRVNGGAIQLIREREDVIHFLDEKNQFCLKLI